MSALRLRRLAVALVRHAAWVLPGARSPWADAMRRELDYIADDRAVLRWALGCVFASYRARLTHRLWLRVREGWRQIATSGALIVLIGVALQEHAGGQTEPPCPVLDETTCDLPNLSLEIRVRLRCGTVAGGAEIAAEQSGQASDTSCTDKVAPIRFFPSR